MAEVSNQYLLRLGLIYTFILCPIAKNPLNTAGQVYLGRVCIEHVKLLKKLDTKISVEDCRRTALGKGKTDTDKE